MHSMTEVLVRHHNGNTININVNIYICTYVCMVIVWTEVKWTSRQLLINAQCSAVHPNHDRWMILIAARCCQDYNRMQPTNHDPPMRPPVFEHGSNRWFASIQLNSFDLCAIYGMPVVCGSLGAKVNIWKTAVRQAGMIKRVLRMKQFKTKC